MTSAKAGMTVSSRLPLLIIPTEFSIQQYMEIKNTEECSCQVSLLYHRAGTVLLGLKDTVHTAFLGPWQISYILCMNAPLVQPLRQQYAS